MSHLIHLNHPIPAYFFPLTQGKSLSYFATSCLAACARTSRWVHGWGLLEPLRRVRCAPSVESCSALCQDGRRWQLALQAGRFRALQWFTLMKSWMVYFMEKSI